MYSFGRDFDEGLKMDDIFREYIERKTSADFMDRASEALSGNGIEIQKKVFDAVSIKLAPFVQAAVNGIDCLLYTSPSPRDFL